MELCYAMISLDRLRQTILQNATDLHVAARVVIFGFLLHTYDNMRQDYNIFFNGKAFELRFTLSHLIIYFPVDFPVEKSKGVPNDCCCN